MVKINADYGKVRISEIGKSDPAYREFTRIGNEVIVTNRHNHLPEEVIMEWKRIAELILLGSQTEREGSNERQENKK